MKNIYYQVLALIFLLTISFSCKKFLDIVPDNVATLDNAFANRTEAEKFLFTCYSYMPHNGQQDDDPSMFGTDELWQEANAAGYLNIPMGFQKIVDPYGDRWGKFFNAIRDCNIFLENIEKVPDMSESERRQWTAEVNVLKAYYNFYLVRMYGPIPLMKENVPINANASNIKKYRAPVDSCFGYIVQLLDNSMDNLPLSIKNPQNDLGRITLPIAMALKAEVRVYAASPLFNGNTQQNTLKGPDGEFLFNQTFSLDKWDSAVVACKRAIDICGKAGFSMYRFQPSLTESSLTDTIKTQLTIRNSVTQRWNSGVIWANSQVNSGALQAYVSTWWDPEFLNGNTVTGHLSPPLKIAEMFYSEHGVPITEDKTWNYNDRYHLQVAGDSDQLYIRKGHVGAHMNFDREPRFYADLGFDGGVWYGQGEYNDQDPQSLFYLEGLAKQRNGYGKIGMGTVTGYFVKKLVHYQNVIGDGSNYSITGYPFPLIRVTDLYLMYAESLNEFKGPDTEAFRYLDSVRVRAGIPTVKQAWDQYSTNPSEYTSQVGLRKIIHQERLIELAFEGKRFWDLRRWKEATTEINKPITSWDLQQTVPAAYYRPVTVYNTKFSSRDYFWPIAESTLDLNTNLQQNLGW
jgi:hypothetical protein